MAEPKVSSMFVPQTLLDMVSPDQAQVAASQARNAFLFNLIGSGDLGQAYNSAQSAGLGTINNAISLQQHAASLAEAQRQAANRKLLEGAAQGAMDTVPGTGEGTADPRYAPRDVNGNELAGPGYIPPQQQFNLQRYLANPNVSRALAADPTKLQSIYAPEVREFQGRFYNAKDPSMVGRTMPNITIENGMVVDRNSVAPGTMLPNREFVNGVLVDKNNAPLGTFVPKLPEGMTPTYGPQGQVTGAGMLPGVVRGQAELAGSVTGAQEGARAGFDLVDVKLPDGSTVKVTRAQAAQMARGGSPLTANQSPAVVAQQGGYEPILKDAYTGYTTANARKATLEQLSSLAANLDTNKFTAAKAELTGYLNALGVTGPQAQQFLANVQTFRQGLNSLAAANFKDMTGAISNFDVQFTLSRQPQLTDTKESNQFNLDVLRATDKRRQEFYRFVQQNPTPDVLLRWEQSDQGKKSIYEDPLLRRYLPTAEVKSGAQKGKTAYQLPDGTWKVFD